MFSAVPSAVRLPVSLTSPSRTGSLQPGLWVPSDIQVLRAAPEGPRFEVVTATSMKVTVVWDAAPCSPVDVDRRLRVSIRRVIIMWAVSSLKRRSTSTGLHGATFQNIATFKCRKAWKILRERNYGNFFFSLSLDTGIPFLATEMVYGRWNVLQGKVRK
jgi:hypothetical protein